jgi:hypothetical protein
MSLFPLDVTDSGNNKGILKMQMQQHFQRNDWRIIWHMFFAVFALTLTCICEARDISCEKQAITDARKLLSFYRDGDNRIEIDQSVKKMHSMKNPANPKRDFDVYEVWGYIYKGNYRMRLIYYTDNNCLLMGEEILEFANL